MQRRRSRFAENTIRTTISGQMAAGPQRDLDRVAPGRYQLREPDRTSGPSDTSKVVASEVAAGAEPDGRSRLSNEMLARARTVQLRTTSAPGVAEQAWPLVLRRLTDRLEGLARQQTAEIYSEVIVGTTLERNPAWHRAISPVLAVIGRAAHDAGLPMLTAVVYGRARNSPGPGFNDLARTLGRQAADEDDLTFWVQELKRVHEAWRGK